MVPIAVGLEYDCCVEEFSCSESRPLLRQSSGRFRQSGGRLHRSAGSRLASIVEPTQGRMQLQNLKIIVRQESHKKYKIYKYVHFAIQLLAVLHCVQLHL